MMEMILSNFDTFHKISDRVQELVSTKLSMSAYA